MWLNHPRRCWSRSSGQPQKGDQQPYRYIHNTDQPRQHIGLCSIMQNPNPTPAAMGPTSTPASSQPTQLKPNNLQPQPRPQLQSQPVRPPAQMQPQSSAQQINRPPSQNQAGPPAPSTASSTSGLLDRTGDKARLGSAGGPVSGGNMQGSTNGPGAGQMMSTGGGNVRPGPGTGGLGHPNRVSLVYKSNRHGVS